MNEGNPVNLSDLDILKNSTSIYYIAGGDTPQKLNLVKLSEWTNHIITKGKNQVYAGAQAYIQEGDLETLISRITAAEDAQNAFFDSLIIGDSALNQVQFLRHLLEDLALLASNINTIIVNYGSVPLDPSTESNPIIETQVSNDGLGTVDEQPPRSQRRYNSELVGQFRISGAFMEAEGHGSKGDLHAVYGSNPQQVVTLPSAGNSSRNIGIDYVLEGDTTVKNWYRGTVLRAGLEGSYGYRVVLDSGIKFRYNNNYYPVYQGYAHLDSINYSAVQNGLLLLPGTNIGIMGGTGAGGANVYGDHVDFRVWTVIDGVEIDISPNVIQSQLKAEIGSEKLNWSAIRSQFFING